jgi:hypothetical protein
LLAELPGGVTLRLYLRSKGGGDLPGEILFSSSKKWLHPLFDLEAFLASRDFPAQDLYLRDRIIGIAAAFLVARLGIRAVETDLVSRGALRILKQHSVSIETLETVDAIACATEKELKDTTDPEEAYALIARRRAKANNFIQPTD